MVDYLLWWRSKYRRKSRCLIHLAIISKNSLVAYKIFEHSRKTVWDLTTRFEHKDTQWTVVNWTFLCQTLRAGFEDTCTLKNLHIIPCNMPARNTQISVQEINCNKYQDASKKLALNCAPCLATQTDDCQMSWRCIKGLTLIKLTRVVLPFRSWSLWISPSDNVKVK